MNKIKFVSNCIVILFCWVIYPYKWIGNIAFSVRKSRAISQANERKKSCNDTVYVVQYGRKFKVGIKSEMKELDRAVHKFLKLKRKDEFIWSYKNAIIYKAI